MPIVVAVLGVVIVVMGAVFFLMPTNKVAEKSPEVVTETINRNEVMEFEEEVVVNANDPTFDGPSISTYTGTGTYLTPARTEHKLVVTLTLTGDIVTDAQVSYDDAEGFSNPSQEKFNSAYKTEVVGKLLKDISLSRVGGASLTSEAFNKAVAEIITNQPA